MASASLSGLPFNIVFNQSESEKLLSCGKNWYSNESWYLKYVRIYNVDYLKFTWIATFALRERRIEDKHWKVMIAMLKNYFGPTSRDAHVHILICTWGTALHNVHILICTLCIIMYIMYYICIETQHLKRCWVSIHWNWNFQQED